MAHKNAVCARRSSWLVVQKNKVDELFKWFEEHFVSNSIQDYVTKCPFLIVQGPTGCGKTTTLKCVAQELKIPVKEYSETTDTTAITYDLARNDSYYHEDDRSLDKRRAQKFEHFVINHLRFNPLYPPLIDGPAPASADSEFDSDDDLPAALRPPPRPVATGVIIHVEAPLSFAKSQKILMSTMTRMIKTIREIARTNPRRVAIVFENLECDKEVISLPTKFKQTIGMQTIKFNPIIRANMKKFIELRLRNNSNVIMDRDAIDLLINDCDGDLRACENTLQLLSNRVQNYNNVFMGLDDDDLVPSLNNFQVNKKQRLNPDRFKLNTSLMRDVTRSSGFFHTLGKIFYQKRLYPERERFHNRKYRLIDRPYPTENSTEYLSSRLDVAPKILLTWLHQHYYRFCHESNIYKASLFLDNLSDIDTISINSIQSSQFYEMHNALDQLQLHLSIEGTVFSLYEDQSKLTKSSHKKIVTNQGPNVIKSSVENFSSSGNGELYSFSKPASLSMPKLIEDHEIILGYCSKQIMQHHLSRSDPTKILVDYLPYLSVMSDYWSKLTNHSQVNGYMNEIAEICKDDEALKLIKLLENLGKESKLDFDVQHEQLIDIIEGIENRSKIKLDNDRIE